MGDGFFQLWFAVRYVHVASIALLVGGAAVVCLGCLSPGASAAPDVALSVATAYEWLFWSVVGVTAATGVSNLGLKGEGLLGPGTSWGAALTLKLTLVLLFLCLSLVRSDVVVRCARARVRTPARVRRVLAVFYGATALVLLATVWIGLGLAHGRY